MYLRKRIQSQDPLLVQQLSCYLGASSVQLALTLGDQGPLVRCQGQQL